MLVVLVVLAGADEVTPFTKSIFFVLYYYCIMLYYSIEIDMCLLLLGS